MLTVETIGRVRREFHVKGKKIKAIARELRVSRNTVRRIVRGDETVHRYARQEQPLPQLGAYVAALEGLLAANVGKSQRERLTFMRMFEELRLSGYVGGYDSVRRYARAWERQQGIRSAEAYVPLSFAPGEAYQFDWSHEVVVLDGVTNVVKVAQVRLCYSRMPFVRAYPREAQEMVFDAHDRAFAFFRGSCARGIYDNMRTAVDAVFVGKERAFTRSNYFRVKDATAFEAWCKKRSLQFWTQSFKDMPNAYAIAGNEWGWPYHEEDDDHEDEEIDFAAELAAHLNPKDVAVLLEIGNEKLRYLVGVATAVKADGRTTRVDLEEIYQRAAEEFGEDLRITDATY